MQLETSPYPRGAILQIFLLLDYIVYSFGQHHNFNMSTIVTNLDRSESWTEYKISISHVLNLINAVNIEF